MGQSTLREFLFRDRYSLPTFSPSSKMPGGKKKGKTNWLISRSASPSEVCTSADYNALHPTTNLTHPGASHGRTGTTTPSRLRPAEAAKHGFLFALLASRRFLLRGAEQAPDALFPQAGRRSRRALRWVSLTFGRLRLTAWWGREWKGLSCRRKHVTGGGSLRDSDSR